MNRDDSSRANQAADRLTQWVRDHGSALMGFLLVQLRDRHQAEDVLQEVFCRAWRAQGRYAEQGHERAYLWRIADRLVRDQFRQRQRQVQATEIDHEHHDPADPATVMPVERLAQSEVQRQLAAAIDSLSEAQRRTLLLRYYGHLEFHEIAEAMELPLNTVLSHARRGLLALRELIKKEGD